MNLKSMEAKGYGPMGAWHTSIQDSTKNLSNFRILFSFSGLVVSKDDTSLLAHNTKH